MINFKKLLAGTLSAAMILGTMAMPVFADESASESSTVETENSAADDYAGFTDLETAVRNGTVTSVDAIVADGVSTDGYDVWKPGKAERGNPPLADAKFGEKDGQMLFVVWRYRNDSAIPYVTKEVKIDGVTYQTVIDMSLSSSTTGGFFTSQNTTQKAKLETGVTVKGADKFFYSNHGLKTLDLPTELVSKLNLATNLDWAYFNDASEQYESYTIGSELTGYSSDRIVLQGANTKPRTLRYKTSANNTYADKKICAYFAIKVDPNGGSCENHTETYTAIESMNSNKTLNSMPTREGFVFNGWTISNDNINKNVTLIAKWADAPCEHNFVEKIIKDSTCTEEGSKTLTCSKCNTVENVTIPKKEHVYKEEIIKEATCTDSGSKKLTCENCQSTKTETISALGHNFKNGECTRCHATQVMEAKIGDKKYDTLSEAISAAKDGDTVVLLEDIKNDKAYKIEDKNLTLELNGKTINAKCSGSAISIYKSIVTIKDSVGNGAIIQTNGYRASAVFATTGSTLRIENGKFVSNGQNGAVNTEGGSKCYVSGSVLEGDGGNVAVFKGGAEVQFDNVTLNALFNKTYQMYSDGIWVENSSLTINSGIYNGSVTALGKTSQISIKGGLFSENVIDYVIPGYTTKPEGEMFRVVKSEAKVIDTAKTAGAEITLNDLEKHDEINNLEDATYEVVVTTASNADIESANAAIAKNADDNNNSKQIYDISIIKTDSNGVTTDVSKDITNQKVTITLSETPQENPVKVYHVNDSGVVEIIENVVQSGNTVTFTAPSFSTYAITYNTAAADPSTITSKVGVTFTKVDNTENQYYVTLKALDSRNINRFMSADLVFKNESTGVDYEITPAANINANVVKEDDASREYHFEMNGSVASSATGSEITLGTITFNGFGTVKLSVDTDYTSARAINIVNTAKASDNIVDNYTVTGNTLLVNSDVENGTIDKELKPETADLTVKVSFPNAIKDNVIAYQDMKVTVSGNGVNEEVKLGTDGVKLNNGVYSIEFNGKLVKNNTYTVTVSGAGYRTARYTVSMTGAKTLNFWNNVKTDAAYVEERVGNPTNTNFLAGDIVKDGKINIYDLSAVVSYFGQAGIDTSKVSQYAKYDLNRDGVIDSMDISYVLVSWGK